MLLILNREERKGGVLVKFSKYNLIIDSAGEEKYIFNTLTGCVYSLTPLESQAIKIGDLNFLDKHTYDSFISSGILIEDDYEENRIIDYYYHASKYDATKLTATVLLTWACNYRCVYCYEGAGEDRSDTMTQATAERVVQYLVGIAQNKSIKNISIVLFGGEPMLNIETGLYILDKLHSYCNEVNGLFSCCMVTNGSLLTKDVLDSLAKFNCKMIQITLDGPPEIHNQRRVSKSGQPTFPTILSKLNLVAQYKKSIACVIRINVDKTNIEYIGDLLRILVQSGLNKIGFIDFGIVRNTTKACADYGSNCFQDDELGVLLDDLWTKAEENGFNCSPVLVRRWLYCGLLALNNYTIAPNADIYKCWEMVGNEDYRIGTIGNTGKVDRLSYAFFDWMSINPMENEECKDCKYLPCCGGGCVMVALSQYGNIHSKGCSKTKGVIEKQVNRFVQKSKNVYRDRTGNISLNP
jgi:uncharacterized protein